MKFVPVYSGESLKAKMIENLLNENGIAVFLRNEYLGSIAPFYASPGGANSTTVEVPENDADEARMLIESFFGEG